MLYHPGPNPTADCILTRRVDNTFTILLIKRMRNAATEPGKLAFPGGFVDGSTRKGKAWVEGNETPLQAAIREVKEETGLDLSNQAEDNFRLLGVYDDLSRDPRNTEDAWIRAHIFKLDLSGTDITSIQANDDAEEANWYTVQEIKTLGKNAFAFDHYAILEEHGFLSQ